MSDQQFLESDIEGEEEGIQDLENGAIRKNLLDDFADVAKTEQTIPNNGRELMKVFLRIRPFTEDEKELVNNQECMEKDGETAILLNAPKDSFTFKNEKRGREVTHRFTFSHVFGAETTQKQFFDNTTLDLVKDFMDGQNCLVFTYGVTNSGKTYTIQGNPKDGGILPRTLDVLFNSIQDQHYTRMNLKPRYFCDVIKINEKQEHMEGALRNGLLMSLNKEQFDLNSFLQLEESNNDITKSSFDDDSSLHASIKSQEDDEDNEIILNIDNDDESRVADDTAVSLETQGPVKFSVWVSFAEVYNEQIYDLLEPCPEGKGKKRTTLKLGDDKHGNPYVKGLREICVSSADEAYKILRVGKKNQRIASTKLNQNSSRSHCIFNIKVLRVVNVEQPHVARVSRLSFVDLAGSERYTKTHSTGDRLKESGNINTSLLTLGKCLENLRYNQMHVNHSQIIPFRESKLTRLFQGFFCGKGKACMIVNINQCPETFDETYHALKFSAIAKQVTTRVSKPVDVALPVAEKSIRASFAFPTPSKVARMSIAWVNGATKTPAVLDNECVEEDEEEGSYDDKVMAYIKQLENLVKQFESQLIEEKKAKAALEFKIREEVCAEMAEQLVAIESEYSERIQEQVSAVEEKCDRRIEILAKSIKKTRKRARIDKQDEDDEERVTFAQLKAEKDRVQSLTSQVNELEYNLDSLKTAFEESEKHLKDQEEVMLDLQNTVETSSKELEIAKIKIDKRDQVIKEKDELIEELKRKLSEQTHALEDKENIVEKKEAEISSLHHDLSQHQQALDDNESFLAQLNTQVKQLSSELTDVKTKKHEQEEEHMKDVRLETALTKKISTLREQLLARDELMKELVQSLEETRTQVELEKGDLMVVCNEQKTKIAQLQAELEEATNTASSDSESKVAALKDQLKKAQDLSVNAQDKLETNCFEKEELQLTLDAANGNVKQLEEQLNAQKEKLDEMVKIHEKSNNKFQELEQLLKNREDEVELLKNETEKLKGSEAQQSDERVQCLEDMLKTKEEEVAKLKTEVEKLTTNITTLEESNEKAKELFAKLESEVSRQEKSVLELEKLKQLKIELHEANSKVVDDLQGKENELNKLVTEVDALNEKLKDVSNENEKLKNQINSASEEKERQIEKEQEVQEVEEKLQKATKENEELKCKISANEENMTTVERKLEEVEETLRKTTAENEQLKNKMNSTQTKLSSLEGKKEHELTQTQQASDDMKELENQLKETTMTLDKKNSQLISRNNTIKRLELSLSEKEAKIAELTKLPNTPTTPGRDFRSREEIKTLRRRLVQADKDNEDFKQKNQDYEKKFNLLNKKVEETSCELSQERERANNLETKLSTTDKELKERVSSLEKELKDAQEISSQLKERFEASEKQLQVYRLQHEETKKKTLQSNEEVDNLKKEMIKAKEELNDKDRELFEMKVKAESFEKKIEEVKLQHCEEVKKSQEEKIAMTEETKNVAKSLANHEEKLKNIEDAKVQEISKLQEEIASKQKMLAEKTEEFESLKKQFTMTEKEKSDELDKVWKTMVELQDVIKERGETIDKLEEKLSKAEARHTREKNTLEGTVAKIKEVMETKGSDRKKLLAQIAELEAKVSTLNDGNKKLIDASEKSEKDIDELRKVLEQQDAVMEEQQEALNERQAEIETLLAETTRLEEQLTNNGNKTDNNAAEVQRLEGTLSVIKEEKEKLENELKERRKEEEDKELTKAEVCRDFEKEKTNMLVKLEKKEGNISKVRAQVKSLQTEKKALEQKCKEKETEVTKLEERLENAEAKWAEYESLVQLKDADVRAAQEEKDTMLKAMREALAVASAKKEEFDAKLEAIEERHASEMKELRKQYEVELTHKMVRTDLSNIEETSSEKPTPKTNKPTNQQPKDETDKPRRQRRTTRSRKTAVSHDENDAPTSTNDEDDSNKENSKDDVLRDITAVTENSVVKDLKDEPVIEHEDRIEIDVTPMQRRKKTSRAAGGSKNKTRKRRSSELPLSEIKSQLSAKRPKKEQTDDDFTPGSVKPKGSRRSTRATSTSSSCSSKKRPPITPMTPMNEERKENELKKQSSIKRKPFFGKLFSGSSSDTTPPKRGRKLLKKDISGPMESFSPCITSVSTTASSTKDKSKARTIITRQLRSRLVKN